jgi:hypothetical protein
MQPAEDALKLKQAGRQVLWQHRNRAPTAQPIERENQLLGPETTEKEFCGFAVDEIERDESVLGEATEPGKLAIERKLGCACGEGGTYERIDDGNKIERASVRPVVEVAPVVSKRRDTSTLTFDHRVLILDLSEIDTGAVGRIVLVVPVLDCFIHVSGRLVGDAPAIAFVWIALVFSEPGVERPRRVLVPNDEPPC